MRESAPRMPLSPAQERLWILEQLSPEGSYNVTLCFELTGVLHEVALRRAVLSVVERHEALRTRIDETEDGLVGRSGTPQAAAADVERVVCDGDDTAIAALMEQAALHPFDLSTGPLLRVRVIDLPGELYIVLVVLHHGAFDGLSGVILSRELWQSYDAHAAGALTRPARSGHRPLLLLRGIAAGVARRSGGRRTARLLDAAAIGRPRTRGSHGHREASSDGRCGGIRDLHVRTPRTGDAGGRRRL
ncbi:hypothetical protein GCM10010295_63250 [Streptomyces intermedius]